MFGIEPNNRNLSNADLLHDTDADSISTIPSATDTAIDFNNLISSESTKNILFASSEVSFQSESSQTQWLENKQKEAINGDPHLIVVCDVDSSRTRGQRKALLLGYDYQGGSAITIYNSKEKSCYIMHLRDEQLARLTSLTDTYNIVLLSYLWKMRANTVTNIFNADRIGSLNIKSFMFQQNKVEILSLTTKSALSYAQKVVKFTKKEALNAKVFFAANNQPGSESSNFFGQDKTNADNIESHPLNRDDITSICKDSYNYVKFAYGERQRFNYHGNRHRRHGKIYRHNTHRINEHTSQ